MKPPISTERLIRFNNHIRLAASSMAAQTMDLNENGDVTYTDTDVYGETISIDVYHIAEDNNHVCTIQKDGEEDEDIARLVLEAAEECNYEYGLIEKLLNDKGLNTR